MAAELKDFDDILVTLGTGRWNLYFVIMLGLVNAISPPHALSGPYVAPAINHTCLVPSPIEGVMNLAVYITADECHYSTNVTDHFEADQNPLKDCTKWEYDKSVFQSTLTSQYDLVCDRAYLRSMYTSWYMFGTMFGSLFIGFFSDRHGRKPTLAVGIIGISVISLLMSWVPSLTGIMILRFLIGFFLQVSFTPSYTMALEVCEPRHRSAVGVVTALPWAFSTMAWGGLAYLIRDWQWLNLVASLPILLMLPYVWYIDESPRWLVVHGHHERALAVLRKAARLNKTQLPDEDKLRKIMEDTQQSAASTETNLKANRQASNKFKTWMKQIGLIFSTRKLRLRTSVMWWLCFTASMVYYGLSLSAVSFSADPFVYMVLGGMMEIPSYSITAPIIQHFGRRLPTVVGYFACGGALLLLAFIPTSIVWLVVTLAMMGKLAISFAYQIILVYTLELYPTEIRLQGLSSSSFVSHIGAIICPFITDNVGATWVPPVMFGSVSIVAGAATLLLPETLNVHMVDTIAQMEDPQRINTDDGVKVNASAAQLPIEEDAMIRKVKFQTSETDIKYKE